MLLLKPSWKDPKFEEFLSLSSNIISWGHCCSKSLKDMFFDLEYFCHKVFDIYDKIMCDDLGYKDLSETNINRRRYIMTSIGLWCGALRSPIPRYKQKSMNLQHSSNNNMHRVHSGTNCEITVHILYLDDVGSLCQHESLHGILGDDVSDSRESLIDVDWAPPRKARRLSRTQLALASLPTELLSVSGRRAGTELLSSLTLACTLLQLALIPIVRCYM